MSQLVSDDIEGGRKRLYFDGDGVGN